MEIHHGKHYATYVNNYNDAIQKQPELDGKPLHDILANNLAMVKDEIKTAVRNNGGGVHNHNLFWEILNPAGKQSAPVGNLASASNSSLGGLDQCEGQFQTAA